METVFDYDEALKMVDGEKELLQVLIDSFISEKVFTLDELNRFISSSSNEDAAAYVHYFKGAARQLSCKKMALDGQNLEDVLRGKKEGDIKELSEKFYESYTETVKTLKSTCNVI